jgi:succinyl-CoA synthetase beta subunit
MAQLNEDLSKRFLARFGVPFQEHDVVVTAAEAAEVAGRLHVPVMVKAQVPVGGRGKAGAVLRADTPADAEEAFKRVTSVDVDGLRARTALVEPCVTVTQELYLAIVVDPAVCGPALLFSANGGVDIEQSGRLHSVPLRLDGTLDTAVLRRAVYDDVGDSRVFNRLVAIAQALSRAYRSLDAQLVEINPLALLADGEMVGLDARLVIDDNALFRQPEIHDALVYSEPRRIEDEVKERTRLDYVRLDGELGLISGGAGLTMAAMDLIAAAGSSAACFLDCSANPTKHGYGNALDLLLSDSEVKGILISIFGGLTQVDRVATTLTALLAERVHSKPITIRLMGTNVEAADQVLEAHGLVNHQRMEDAVAVAVATISELETSDVAS